jgi:hypothetical protein
VQECNGEASSSRVTLISTTGPARTEQADAEQRAGSTARNASARQASAADAAPGDAATSAPPRPEQDMQRSDDMQSSHSDM